MWLHKWFPPVQRAIWLNIKYFQNILSRGGKKRFQADILSAITFLMAGKHLKQLNLFFYLVHIHLRIKNTHVNNQHEVRIVFIFEIEIIQRRKTKIFNQICNVQVFAPGNRQRRCLLQCFYLWPLLKYCIIRKF